ncbi:EF-hand domain-containing protein [Pseudomonas fluorescens]|uniref:EF-hand domain-containing protein n=1 Tax=Pseudomonas fluorescens TaxID=294 RepID=UPI0009374D2B|nr:EF-hand domain-containing protein [Pseudomonas fluorescens]
MTSSSLKEALRFFEETQAENEFKRLDSDEDGFITKAEFVTDLLSSLSNIGWDEERIKKQIPLLDENIKRLDLDGDDKINLHEFTEEHLRLKKII